jgi:extradiol dioxygenase family protein
LKAIFHLSFPVRDLPEAIAFYTDRLGGTLGRQAESFADIFLFGAQVTLQDDPSSVTEPMPRSRHFGATLPLSDWEAAALRFEKLFVEPPKKSYVGEPIEQAKFMIADPSGNLIEVKAYRHPQKVLEIFDVIAASTAPRKNHPCRPDRSSDRAGS